MSDSKFAKSPKELFIEEKLLISVLPEKINNDDLPYKIINLLIHDEEIAALQDYANHVSIKRLGYNDHGPVHMRTVCNNCIKMMKLLNRAGIETSLEREGIGSFADSLTSVIFASFLHDLGMTIGRQDHELHGANLAMPIIKRLLEKALPSTENSNEMHRRIMIQSMAMEGIVGHMGSHKIHSLEAGTILVGDGCDMEKGRARIPMAMNTEARQGDIHKYSANSIESVKITSGLKEDNNGKPIRIDVLMSSDVGFFQIEEVLLPKINSSTIKNYVEVYAGVQGHQLKHYL